MVIIYLEEEEEEEEEKEEEEEAIQDTGQYNGVKFMERRQEMAHQKGKNALSLEQVRRTSSPYEAQQQLGFPPNIESQLARIKHPSNIIVFKCSCNADIQESTESISVDIIKYWECSECCFPQPKTGKGRKCALCQTTMENQQIHTIEAGRERYIVALKCALCKNLVPKLEVAKYYALIEKLIKEYSDMCERCPHSKGHESIDNKGKSYKMCKSCYKVEGLKPLTGSSTDTEKAILNSVPAVIKEKCKGTRMAKVIGVVLQIVGFCIPIPYVSNIVCAIGFGIEKCGTLKKWSKKK